MKKSTRFLALLLCLVMVATLMPTFAFADNETGFVTSITPSGKIVDEYKTDGKPILKLDRAARYSITAYDNGQNFKDSGYGFETQFLFPMGNGTSTLTITRDANDINRWWRWAKTTDEYNQRKSNSEVGYDDSTAPGIDGWDAKVAGKTVPKEKERVQKYIVQKPFLSPRPYCFLWRGGNDNRAEKVEVTIKRDGYTLGTTAVLWSANGTSSEQLTAYWDVSSTFLNGLRKDHYVHYGDLGKNYMTIADKRYVVYDTNGGNWADGSDTDMSYLLWTTGTVNTSQKHKVISAEPEKEGKIFGGWKVVAVDNEKDRKLLNTTVIAGSDVNNGIVGNIRLEAIWINDIAVPDYVVVFKGNGNTNTDVADYTQNFEYTVEDNLTANKYERVYTVEFDPNGGTCSVSEEVARYEFAGWADKSNITVKYDNATRTNAFGNSVTLDGEYSDSNYGFDAAYYANTYSDIYEAFKYNKTALFDHYLVNGTYEGRSAHGDTQGLYPDGALVNNLRNEYTTEKEGNNQVVLEAQWTPVSITLPDPVKEPDENEENIAAYLFLGWYDENGTRVGIGGDVITPTADMKLIAKWKEVKEESFYIYHSSTGEIEVCSMKDYINRETKDVGVEQENGTYELNEATFTTGYKDTLDITTKVEPGYIYGGTFENEEFAEVADFRGKYFSLKYKEVPTAKHLISGNFYNYKNVVDEVNTPEVYTADGTATAMYPQSGKTYYIWEVSKQHLNPMTVSVWANVDGGYDITDIYLMTAVDRTLYNQVGFTVNGNDIVAANSTNMEVYDKVSITQNGRTTDKSYYDLSFAPTTQDSKVSCLKVDVPMTETNVTVVPYWITLDGVRVTGPAQRIFQYMGPGASNSNRTLKIVSDDWIDSTANLAPAPVSFAAPLKAAPRFMASQASSVVIQAPDIITVFDAGKEYTIEAVNNSIKDIIKPAGVDGQLFGGWFADEALTAAADLDNVSDGDSVYAKYISGNYLQVKYAAAFTLLNKTISLTAAVDSKDYAETGFVIETKNGTDTVVVNSYATKFALQNAGQLFGVEKNAPLMNVDYKLNGLARNDKVTITPYWVTADGTTVYGVARTLTFNGLVMKG